MAIRMKPRDLRTGLGYLFVVSIMLGLLIANWEPTPNTDELWISRMVVMGFTFLPVVAAFSLTLFIASFSFEEVAGD